MKRIGINVFMLLTMLMFFFSNTIQASADQIFPSEAIVFIDKYEITNERIIPGESFTLSITLKNYSILQDAENVQIDIQNPSGVAPVYGSLSQLYIGEIKAGEEKIISFEYDSWTSIKSDTLDFIVFISSDTMSHSFTLRVPSSADIPFSLLAFDVPSKAYIGEYNSASLTFKVLGEENVSDIILNIECNNQIVGSSQAGSITAGTTKTQNTSFMINEAGNHILDLYLEYVTSDGEKNKVLIANKAIVVDEKSDYSIDNNIQDLQQKDNRNSMYILGISGILILTIFVLIVVIIRRRR